MWSAAKKLAYKAALKIKRKRISEHNKKIRESRKPPKPIKPKSEKRFYASRNGSILPNKYAAYITDEARAKYALPDD